MVQTSRSFFWVDIWWYLLSAALVILAFFLLFPLVRLSNYGLIVFFSLIIAGVGVAVRKYVIWHFNIFLITNQRLVIFEQKGIFHKNVTETAFDNIQDISYNKKGVWPTVLDYGTIIVKTASLNSKLEFKKVKNPGKIQEKLVEIQTENANNDL